MGLFDKFRKKKDQKELLTQANLNQEEVVKLNSGESNQEEESQFEQHIYQRCLFDKIETLECYINRIIDPQDRIETTIYKWTELASRENLTKQDLLKLYGTYLENKGYEEKVTTKTLNTLQNDLPFSEPLNKDQLEEFYQSQKNKIALLKGLQTTENEINEITDYQYKPEITIYKWTAFASKEKLTKQDFLKLYGTYLKNKGYEEKVILETLNTLQNNLPFSEPLSNEQLQKFEKTQNHHISLLKEVQYNESEINKISKQRKIYDPQAKNYLAIYKWTKLASEAKLTKQDFLKLYGTYLQKNGYEEKVILETLNTLQNELPFSEPPIKGELSSNLRRIDDKLNERKKYQDAIFYGICKEKEQMLKDNLNPDEVKTICLTRLHHFYNGLEVYKPEKVDKFRRAIFTLQLPDMLCDDENRERKRIIREKIKFSEELYKQTFLKPNPNNELSNHGRVR